MPTKKKCEEKSDHRQKFLFSMQKYSPPTPLISVLSKKKHSIGESLSLIYMPPTLLENDYVLLSVVNRNV